MKEKISLNKSQLVEAFFNEIRNHIEKEILGICLETESDTRDRDKSFVSFFW